INGQTTRYGYNGLLAHGSKGARAFGQDGQALLHRWIVRLETHHAPGALDQSGPDSWVTSLGHTSGHALAAAAAFPGTKPGVRTDGASIVEPVPVADLTGEHHAGELAQSPRERERSEGLQFSCKGIGLCLQTPDRRTGHF